jgi:hypothetical protein
MKTTTTYLQGCTWCNATGIKYPMQNIGTGFSSICPICNGNKTVLVTEVSEPITTELIVPSEEEIEKEALERAKYESYPIDKDYDMQSFSDFVGAVKWAISEIKKLNK